MRQKSTGFDCENKSWWNLGTPVLERHFTRQAIEAVVEFDRVELPGEKNQPVRKPQICRVKLAIPPVSAVPAACSDVCLSHPKYLIMQLAWQVLLSTL
jgi:hypothetical protein